MKNSMRFFEKALYKSEYVNEQDYPLQNEEAFAYMRSIAKKSLYCFPYYRSVNGRRFIDIYVWDKTKEREYTRFVIVEGYSFELEHEECFFAYMTAKGMVVDSKCLEKLMHCINKHHPEINLIRYSSSGHILLHLYFTSFRNTIYEILFKANLNWISVHLDKMKEINIAGKSPQEILGVHINMLRALNHPMGVESLVEPADRDEMNQIYAAFHNNITRCTINCFQLWYLRRSFSRKAPFDKKMFLFFGKLREKEDFYTYIRYLEYKEIVDDYYSALPQYPKNIEQLKELYKTCEEIAHFVEKEDFYDELYSKHREEMELKYRFEDERYIIYPVKDMAELVRESGEMHNCLRMFMERAMCGDVAILLMREKAYMKHSLIAVEVRDGKIMQARRAFNVDPNEEEQAFLDKFANEKNLRFFSFDDAYFEAFA